jgi:hypothetical protein
MRYRPAVLGSPLLATVAVAGACRAIAGIDGDLRYGPADAGVDAKTKDAGSDVELPDAAACPAGSPEVLFHVTSAGLGPIFVTDAAVYVEVVRESAKATPLSSSPYSGLVTCPKSGCSERPETVVDSSQAGAKGQWGGATLAQGGVYFSTSSLSPVTSKGDSGSPQDAGSISLLAATTATPTMIRGGLGDPFSLAVAGDTLYWVDDPQWMSFNTVGNWRVFRCTLPSCDDAAPFMTGTSVETYGLYVDSANVYVEVADPASGMATLYACAKDAACGGAPMTALGNLSPPSNTWPTDPLLGGDAFASDGTDVFWGDANDYQIVKVVRGAASPPVLAFLNLSVAGMAVDATYVYWALQATGAIQRTRKDGLWPPTTWQNVVCAAGTISNVAVDGRDVYFETVDGFDATVWRAPLPGP